MTESDIYVALVEVFRDVFDDDSITIGPETTAADIEGWDSQAHVSLIVATEMRWESGFERPRSKGSATWEISCA